MPTRQENTILIVNVHHYISESSWALIKEGLIATKMEFLILHNSVVVHIK